MFIAIEDTLIRNEDYTWEEKILISYLISGNKYFNEVNGTFFCPSTSTISKFLNIDESKIKLMLLRLTLEGLIIHNMVNPKSPEKNFYDVNLDNLGDRLKNYYK